ncbi:helix-turn-helix domain-containing protein [Candidatus Stoquefichus sp. SB1]|uniref:helix-turn-helix domain-containing protein n=1 Tax=Candidatus Stoquefichus sp. SB1 TaxID=1658109 RepID=UPI00067EA6D3|nr:helix-turn-helix transcriptional regulator [Candidatus Stoquefichus sp. SB1]
MGVFGERLKQLRTSMNLSQQELSDELKIGRSTLANYEQGKREPNFETLEIIADYFNVDMNYLTGWKQDQYFKNLENNPDALKEGYDENIKYLMEHEGGHLVDLYKELINNESLILLMDKATKLKPADVANLIRIADAFEKETFGDKDEPK